MATRQAVSKLFPKSPKDVVFVSALRTPVTRAKKGGFKDAYPEELLSHILKATLTHTSIDPKLIDDVCIGNVLPELGGAKGGRMAQLHAGYDVRTSFHTVNRQCSSGLQAITQSAHAIMVGQSDVVVAGGVESMTRNYGSRAIPVDLSPELKKSPVKDALDCIMPMGITSENVAERYGVTREDQDAFALESHRRAEKAQKEGKFDGEIVPVQTRWIEEDGTEIQKMITKDDGVRRGLTIDKLQKLKPAFKEDGTCTAGNSSQVSDGAAASLLMRREVAEKLGYTPIARFIGSQVAGCPPDEMGMGPLHAIPRLLSRHGLRTTDVDIYELNEAFATQALACMRGLKLENAIVNPNGGAIALGHPLGATGARQVATLLGEMGRTDAEVGVVSMCIGTGMGMASLIVKE
ncbi:3-ketoacyl-CoA thiolase B [Saitoella complicata NRRL Y-17804]|uniref:acetyl-CoA C-acyltransferase n=1 Tax=Saitoella complicata (strain BCRC 22490 / CBS 7301 / JCM 7358 / NBRC 10748 / NRRL Y-17804) TaxID=698492 RepID=A0A0E9NC81_SAICN|nr:3-ketoacyl-CoA thiolase B [Saitoella complicata NRRL Y-17804]ODQ53790.1 3-ketoacyl-CoA thiolase B [Saitoella complicata NRRL Y-17804]GAO47015.1 hypothetical protein G7K_1229-t1 [Saitoella complicata NRRL Y-17804]